MTKKKTFNEMFGEKVKTLRDIHGMTQIDLAFKIGYESTGMISQIENGLKGMSDDIKFNLAKLFKVPMAILLNDKEYSKDDLKMLVKMMEILELSAEERPEHFKSIKILLDNL